jgi:hypothetical protein
MYYRMLGANIGKAARISIKAEIAEFDLVTIMGETSMILCEALESTTGNGCMILCPEGVGNASVGARSIVAPCTAIPDGRIHVGPVSSSYEVCGGTETNTHHQCYNWHALKEPSLFTNMVVVGPISFLVVSFSNILCCWFCIRCL